MDERGTIHQDGELEERRTDLGVDGGERVTIFSSVAVRCKECAQSFSLRLREHV